MADNADVAAKHDEILQSLRERERRSRGIVVNTTGLCEDCEAVIPKERLEHLPTAMRCVDCQSEKEKRDRMYAS